MLVASQLELRFGPRQLFTQLSFELAAGETLAIVGPTGVGKSSLLKCVAWFLPLAAGTLHFDDRTVHHWGVQQWRRNLCYVAQHPPPLVGSAEEFLNEVARLRVHAADEPDTFQPRAEEYARAFGLEQAILNENFDKLSGGEKQRVYLALVLATRPKVLLLDEPTSALDPETKLRVENVLADFTSLWVSHDPQQLERVAGARLELGK